MSGLGVSVRSLLGGLACWVGVVGCGDRDGDTGDTDGVVVVDSDPPFVQTEDTDTPSTTTTFPVWPGPRPILEPDEQTQGEIARMKVALAPPGATVTFYRSAGPEGPGPCEGGACLDIPAPEELGSAVSDAYGFAYIEYLLPEDEPPAAWFLQARVADPTTGASTTTPVELRYVSLSPETAAASFVDATLKSGILIETSGNTHTGGIVWADFDGDWWPDLFVSNGAGARRGLFLNNGDGTFDDRSDQVEKSVAGIEDAGAVAGDFDGDGDVDIVVAGDNPTSVDIWIPQPYEGGPNEMFLNDGLGRFTPAGPESGVIDPRGWRTSAIAAADYDHDGLLDLWLGNWAMAQLPAGDNFGRLLHNTGGAIFEDVPGPDAHGRDTLEAIWFDADFDTWPDLYVGNVSGEYTLPDYDPRDVLYHNDGGTFTDVTADSPGFGDDAWAAMGADVADIDNDGDWELYVTNLFFLPTDLPRGNPLYMGNPDGTFTDNQCDVAGVCTGHETWPAVFADFDRDKWVDLYVGTSTLADPDLLFVNDGDGTFSSHRVAVFQKDVSRGGSQADFDGDGAVDLFVWMWGHGSRLYRAEPRDDHHWLELKLLGRQSNPDAIGAWIEIESGGTRQLRWVSGGDSAHSQRDTIVHVGLGDDESATVTIHWPSGVVQPLGELDELDRLYAIDEQIGIIPEVIAATAQWDASVGTLEVLADSSYHGRSHLSVDGYGDLAWDRRVRKYVGRFTAPVDPGPVTVRPAWGAPVDVEPVGL